MLEATLPVLAVVRLAIYSYFGLYATLWEYASLPELWAIVRAGTVASAVDWPFLHYALADLAFPRSVTLTMWAVNIGLCSTVRFSARVRQEWAATRANRSLRPGAAGPGVGPGRGGAPPPGKSRVLLVGAGQAGCIMARELNAHPELPYAAVGFLDDDPAKQGCIICGLQLLGTISDLAAVARRLRVGQVFVAMPSAPGPAVKRVFDACSALKIGIKTIPGIYELLDGKVTVNRLRPVEIHDLLRRRAWVNRGFPGGPLCKH